MKAKIDTGKKQESSAFNIINEDFIPYTFHYNGETLTTKNGHLLQIIKINNFGGKDPHHNTGITTLRELVRSAIKDSVKTDDFAFWIHTVRRRANLKDLLKTDHPKLIKLNEAWSSYNEFNMQFENELYVTVIIKGVEFKTTDVAKKYFTHAKLKAAFEEGANAKFTQLEDVTQKLLSTLSNYYTRKLKIIERDGVYCSEILEFLNKILNLNDERIAVDEVDASSLLSASEICLGLNKITVKNSTSSHSISVLTLKQYVEVKPDLIDDLLSLPFEFIIYQAFDFINPAEANEKFLAQQKMLRVSNDRKMSKFLGFEETEFEEAEAQTEKAKLRYGESQISIIIIAEQEKDIESETKRFVDIISKIGFVVVRDDVNIEDSFFGSLPGNFSFLRRMQPIKTERIAGFASIDNKPTGKAKGNEWGDAVCMFKTKEGLPFYFNFHDESKSGHTIVLGKSFDVQQNAISNFLLMQSLKFKPQIITVDFSIRSRTFNYFLQGDYKEFGIERDQNTLHLNPFFAFKFGEEVGLAFCKKFFELSLVIENTKNTSTIKYMEEKLMPYLKNHYKEVKTLKDFIGFIKNDKVIQTFFKYTNESGVLAHLFENEVDDILSNKADVLSINIRDCENSEVSLVLLFEYVVEAILIKSKQNSRTIVKFEGFIEMALNLGFSKERVADILQELKNNNCVLMMIENYTFFQNYIIEKQDSTIVELISTAIFTPAFISYGVAEDEITSGFINNIGSFFNLTTNEKEMIMENAFTEKYFVSRHSERTTVLEFNYQFSKMFYTFLASRGININLLSRLKKAKTFEELLIEAQAISTEILK